MRIFTFAPKEYFGSNMYIAVDGTECAVIDPSVRFSECEHFINKNGLKLKYVILTHAHFDHMLEIDSWVEGNTGAEVIVGRDDSVMLADSDMNCYNLFFGMKKGYYGPFRTVSEGDTLALGEAALRVFETPGHTRGSVSLLCDGKLFVGDVVFADGGVGRCDLPGGDYLTLSESIKRISSLDSDIDVYSGHGRMFKIKELK